MINQTAKKILKALSFDGVEVEAFRHMADLKRLDPMKIFYKKVDEKIYNGSHAVPIRIFFPSEKSFREIEEKKHDIQDKNCFCSYMAVDGLQKVLIIMKEFALGLRMQPDNM